ncbi:hypothetical protein JTB14_029488 [Gonioctena quinquepunctata]|nr:hypothetical protein JTB14_029488 [Gonioctena quinquepunctata]
MLAIPGYSFVRADRVGRGGGLGIFVKAKYMYKIICTDMCDSLEQLWISVKIKNKTIVLGVAYRPPNANVPTALEKLESNLTNFLPTCETLLVAADFNINLLSTNASVQLFNDFVQSYNLSQIVTEPTRVTSHSQTLIHIIITSNPEVITKCDVFDLPGISDHFATLCTMKFPELKPETRYITFRDYKNFQLPPFLADLGEVSWNTIYTLQNVDEQVEFFNQELITLLYAHAPLRKIKVSKPYSPWYTYNIRQMIKLRDKAL